MKGKRSSPHTHTPALIAKSLSSWWTVCSVLSISLINTWVGQLTRICWPHWFGFAPGMQPSYSYHSDSWTDTHISTQSLSWLEINLSLSHSWLHSVWQGFVLCLWCIGNAFVMAVMQGRCRIHWLSHCMMDVSETYTCVTPYNMTFAWWPQGTFFWCWMLPVMTLSLLLSRHNCSR